jgi:hypothetical protein
VETEDPLGPLPPPDQRVERAQQRPARDLPGRAGVDVPVRRVLPPSYRHRLDDALLHEVGQRALAAGGR